MDSQKGPLLKPQSNLKNANMCLKMNRNILCHRKMETIHSFQIEDHGIECVQAEIYSHIWDNRNKKHVSLNLDELACMLTKKAVTEEIGEQLLIVNEEIKSSN